MDKESLKTLRDEINDIDNQLLSLIVKRTNIVEKIGLIKKNPENIVDKNRESEVLSRLLASHQGKFSKESLIRIWREIFHTSANVQLKNNNILLPKRGVDTIKLYN